MVGRDAGEGTGVKVIRATITITTQGTNRADSGIRELLPEGWSHIVEVRGG